MSYHVFFAFSTGLSKPIKAPKGTKEEIWSHIEETERVLNLTRTQYEKNPPHWDSFKRDFSLIDKELLCDTVSQHNQWVRAMWHKIGKWAKEPVSDGETITPKQSMKFWFGFEILNVSPCQWTGDYYREQMEALYEVMRGRETNGISLDTDPLNEKQAAAVINLFSGYLDPADMRLDVPNGHDYLASSSDGGYEWCEKCGPMVYEDAACCGKRGCPLRKEFKHYV